MGTAKSVGATRKGTAFDPAAVEALKASIKGRIFTPGDDGYDEARTIWNATVDRKPEIIIQCAGVADVIQAVNFARKNNALTAIRGGGHNVAGNAMCDGGVVIDLSQMNSVTIDPIERIAHVGPGATLGDFDHEALAHGLSTPVGINSTTGIAGLTLGGGFGWLSRKYGMTVDNLTAVDVVTSKGEFVRASEKENPDLFWAIRGGGGNFGVVTRFEYKLYPVRTEVLSGLVIYSLDDAVDILKKYREFVPTLGDDSAVWAVLRQAPPLPFLPEKYHGKEVIALAMFHAGDPEEGKKALEPVRNFGTVIGEHIGVQPYVAWQQAFDPLLTPGARNYWKTHNFSELKDGLFDVVVEYCRKLPSPHTEIFLGQLAGQVGRVKPDATAYPHRAADYIINVHGRWEEASDDEKCIGWSREFFNKSAPFAMGGAYINFMTADETDRVKEAFGSNYNRLLEIKKKYDPENLFRVNQNINPKG